MKKITKISLFALMSLTMFSCSKGNTSSFSSSSEAGISNQASSTSSSSAKTSSTVSTSKVTSSDKESSSSSSSSASQDETLWGTSISSQMKEYLGGVVLPYVNLGKTKNLICEYKNSLQFSTSYLRIDGEDYDANTFQSFVSIFQNAGYIASIDSENDVLTATNEALNLKVEISHTAATADEVATYILKAYYDEPFDLSKGASSYSSDEIVTIHSYLDNHDIPYINFGSSHLYLYISSTGSLRVIGWKWDDSLLTSFKTAYQQAGYEVKENEGVLTATLEEEDKCILTATISKPSNTARAYMEITLSEGYNPSAITAYSADDLQTMHDEMDNHELPFIYLGTKNPTISFKSDTGVLTYKGGLYHDGMFDLAKASLESAGWTTENYIASYGAGLRAYRLFDDGCYITLSVEQPYRETSNVVLYATYCKKTFDVPSEDEQEWDSTTKQTMMDSMNGHVLPYFFLGDKKTNCSFSTSSSTLSISPKTSNTYSPRIMSDARKALEDAGYTVTVKNKSNGLYDLEAEYTDTADHSYFFITIYGGSHINGNLYGTASCSVTYLEGYNKENATSWEQGTSLVKGETTTKVSMDDHLEGHSVPFVYLGLKKFTSSWDSTARTMTVYGGNWNESMIEDTKASIQGDSDTTGTWSEIQVTSDATNLKTLTSTKTFTDGSSITLTLKQPSKGTGTLFSATTLTLLYRDTYGATESEWPETVSKNFATQLGGNTFPYIYLHSVNSSLNVKASYNESSSSTSTIGSGKQFGKYITIKGGIWDSRLIDDAKQTLLDDGYTLSNRTRYNQDSLEGVKQNSDGSTMRFVLMPNGTSKTDVAKLMIFYDEPETFQAGGAYTDEEKTKINSVLGYELPFLYVSDINRYTVNVNNASSSSLKNVTLTTNKTKNDAGKYTYCYYHHNYFDKNKEILENDGWTCSINEFGNTGLVESAARDTILTASKMKDDGSIMKMTMKYSSNAYTMTFSLYPKYELPSSGSYSENTLSKMHENFDGNEIPYIYLGTDEDYISSSLTSSKSITLRGKTWDDKIFTDVENTLKADEEKTWTTMFYYDKSYGKVLLASGEFTKDGEIHHFTLKLYKNSYDFPILEIYYVA